MTHPHDPIIYLNGRFLPKSQASLSIDERGMFYGDGIYEVLRFYAGKPLAMDLHMDRMRKSLSRIELPEPPGLESFPQTAATLLEKNNLTDARFYWQITRGASPRHVIYPDVPPTELILIDPAKPCDSDVPVPTTNATLAPDERWANCWIKSLMLLPNVLAANAAQRAGFGSAILHRGDTVTEATNANAMVVRDGTLWTHPADRHILNGVTRQLVLQCALRCGIPVYEKTFTKDQLLNADEVMLTGTTIHVTAVTHVDGQPIRDAKPGPVTQQLHDALNKHIADACL